jgi:hypothetical protein
VAEPGNKIQGGSHKLKKKKSYKNISNEKYKFDHKKIKLHTLNNILHVPKPK